MAKVRIVYGSETGNTESIAKMLSTEISAAGHEVTCESAADVPAKNLAEGYDCVLLGASAWGTDTLELQSDFDEYSDEFSSMGLGGKKGAAFASGDTSYEYYCGAVDFIEEKFNEENVTIVAEGLRVEGDASDGEDEIKAFAAAVVKAL